MFLTYSSIVMSYVPLLLKEGLNTPDVQQGGPGYKVVMILIMIPLMYIAPFLGGLENILGIIIIGIGVYEAWKINKKSTLQVSGPYSLAARPVVPPPTPSPTPA